MKRLVVTLCAVALLALAPQARAEEAADREAIRQTALDYIEGYYEGNGERMERALHPELAKRIVMSRDGLSMLQNMGSSQLIAGTKLGGGKGTPKDKQRKEVKVLDVFENAASVRIDATDWVDYLHVVKWNGRWVIVNVLWELRPQQ
ncbi:MAG TPA: nuclear transport factor 2 family protein [Thermoanaerobaculia bacterium]|nr:nuclear transport factor 2 family protein [Thermoanaerobaculia bacterium]HSK78814.1 nuclear transport factor 2 family protein [Thermoanaerobaculia bacterium]HSN88509.1 nuclear transport factor 2 family protein [Thermoanaerobaculia bacterium]